MELCARGIGDGFVHVVNTDGPATLLRKEAFENWLDTWNGDCNFCVNHLRMQSVKGAECKSLQCLAAGDDAIRIEIKNFKAFVVWTSKLPSNRGRIQPFVILSGPPDKCRVKASVKKIRDTPLV